MIAPHATAIRDLYPLLRPDEALEAGDPRYVDLDNARGRRNVAARLLQFAQDWGQNGQRSEQDRSARPSGSPQRP